MKVFEIIVYAIVALLLIAIIVSMFVSPEQKTYNEFAKSTINALDNPGVPYSFKYNLDDKDILSNAMLSNNRQLQDFDGLLFFFFKSQKNEKNFRINVSIDANNNYISSAKPLNKIYRDDATVICNPYFAYLESQEFVNYDINNSTPEVAAITNYNFLDNYVYFCELILGQKIDGKVEARLNNPFEGKIKLGKYEKTVSITGVPIGFNQNDFVLKVFVFSGSKPMKMSQELYSLKPNLDRNIVYMAQSNFNSGIARVEIPFEYVGKYIILYEVVSKDVVLNNLGKIMIGPAAYISENVEAETTYEDLSIGCKTLDKKYSYFDFDNSRCVYNYNCSDCLLPSMCLAEWTKKISDLESGSSDYAIGYEPPESCNMQNIEDDQNNPNNQQTSNSLDLAWPVKTDYVSSCFGYRIIKERTGNHDGLDLSGKIGDPVYAVNDGLVSSVSAETWGLVTIDHGNYFTRYIHLDTVSVSVGQQIKKGQQIGTVGGRGPNGKTQYAPHLHYELLFKGVTSKGNVDEFPGEDVFLATPQPGALAINPLCAYNQNSFKYNTGSKVCNSQGGALKWCDQYKDLLGTNNIGNSSNNGNSQPINVSGRSQEIANAITSRIQFANTAYIAAAIEKSSSSGVDSCYLITAIKHESNGIPDAIGNDASVASCNVISRRDFAIMEIPECSGYNSDTLRTECNSGVKNACTTKLLDSSIKPKKPTKEDFCSGNYNENYTYGIGLGQITPSKGTSSITITGVTYTHCDLMDPTKNIDATVNLFKEKGATSVANSSEMSAVFTKYCGSSECVSARQPTFDTCKSVMSSFGSSANS